MLYEVITPIGDAVALAQEPVDILLDDLQVVEVAGLHVDGEHVIHAEQPFLRRGHGDEDLVVGVEPAERAFGLGDA